MPADRACESLPTQVAAGDEVTHVTTLGAIVAGRHADRHADRLEAGPLFLQRKISRQLRKIIVSFINTAMTLLARFVSASVRVPKVIFHLFVKERLNRLIELRLIFFDRQGIVAAPVGDLLGDRFLAGPLRRSSRRPLLSRSDR